MKPKHLFTGIVLIIIILLAVLMILDKKEENDITIHSIDKSYADSLVSVSKNNDAVKGSFLPTSDNLYVRIDCGVADEWQLYMKDNGGMWIETPLWHAPSSLCLPECENNMAGVASCDGACLPYSDGCKKLDNKAVRYPETNWNKKFYEVREGNCDEKQGEFIFVEEAPAGEYKLRFTYYKDSECTAEEFDEKAFELK